MVCFSCASYWCGKVGAADRNGCTNYRKIPPAGAILEQASTSADSLLGSSSHSSDSEDRNGADRLDDTGPVFVEDTGVKFVPEDSASLPRSPLFDAIKRREWEKVIIYLHTGKWTAIIFHDDFAHFRAPSPREQCRMWVSDDDFVKRLPLHAAILAGAPSAVLECLLAQYQKAVQCADSSGKLPLELALSANTTDMALLALVKAWPEAVPNAMRCTSAKHTETTTGAHEYSARNQFLVTVVKQTALNTKKKEADAWKKIMYEAGIEFAETDDLTSVLSALLKYRKCLRRHEVALADLNTETASQLVRKNCARSWRRKKDHKAEI